MRGSVAPYQSFANPTTSYFLESNAPAPNSGNFNSVVTNTLQVNNNAVVGNLTSNSVIGNTLQVNNNAVVGNLTSNQTTMNTLVVNGNSVLNNLTVLGNSNLTSGAIIGNTLQVNSGYISGLAKVITVPAQAAQDIGGNLGVPTTLCSFNVPNGTFFMVCVQSIASNTTYAPVTAFSSEIYLSNASNQAYNSAVQYQSPYYFNIAPENPRVTPVPLSTGGQIWCVKSGIVTNTLYLVANSLTPLNLCQADNLTFGATLLAWQ